MQEKLPPTGWGTDSLTKSLDAARDNLYATFHRKKEPYYLILEIDKLFYKAARQGNYKECQLITASLLIRCHSSYRCACQIALQTQTSEAFVMLRNTLEYALYAFLIKNNSDLQELWLNRNEKKHKMKKAFALAPIIKSIQDTDKKLYSAVDELYKRCIDTGAHPNPDAVLHNANISKISASDNKFSFNYFAGDGLALDYALKTTSQIGLTSLILFSKIFPERFMLLGIAEKIKNLINNNSL